MGKPGGHTLLGRPTHRCKDNIKTDLQEIGWKTVDWIYVAHGRDMWRVFVFTVIKFMVS